MGVAGKITVKEENIFKRLLELDTIRGPHSTGFLAVDALGDTEVMKKLGTPWELYQYKQFDEIFKSHLCILMGHNRWATKGKISKENAHPFRHGHIIGAHNGTLRNQSLLDDYKEFEVDSDNVFHHMSKHGVDDTIKKLNGAFALTWYNTLDESINFIRNDERPLFYVLTEDNKTLFWASESWMLEVTLGLSGVKHHRVMELPVGTHFSFKVDLSYAPKEFAGTVCRKLELFSYPIYKRTETTTFQKAKEAEENAKGKQLRTTASQLMQRGSVTFSVLKERETATTKQKYLSCVVMEDDCEVEVRVYCCENPQVRDWMLNSLNYFTGTPRSFVSLGNSEYVVVDIRSLQELIPEVSDEPEDDFFVVYGDEIVDAEEFDKRTLGGCAWCGSVAFTEDAEDLIWLSKNEYVCGDCKHVDDVKKLLSDFNVKQTKVH